MIIVEITNIKWFVFKPGFVKMVHSNYPPDILCKALFLSDK